MELKAGYKNTEVGVIPEDWAVKELSKLTSLMTNGFVGIIKSQYTESDDGVTYIQGYNVEENSFNYSGIKKVTREFHKLHLKSCLQERDLLTIQTGDVGLTTIVPKELVGSNCHALIISRFKKNICYPKYFSFYLNSNVGRAKLKEIEIGTTMKHINVSDMLRFLVPVPTKEEQTAIANTLSDADDLISSLEKLIAKKRNIKQGAMQNLLQPKDGWETKTLKELARYRRGSFPQPYGLDKWYDDINGYPFVQVFDVDDNFRLKNETKRKISKAAQQMSVYIEKGSIVITIQGSIGRIAITHYDAYVDRTLLFFESFIVPFDKYFFLRSISNLFEIEKEKAPGGIIKTITKEALSSFTISYPKIEEQTRIASILSDMDAEITVLENKLDKYRKIKLGMMQNLLTGQIRLI